MCARPLKMANHFAGTPRTDFNSSAEVNSACGKVFPWKTLYAPLGAVGAHTGKECLHGEWYRDY